MRAEFLSMVEVQDVVLDGFCTGLRAGRLLGAGAALPALNLKSLPSCWGDQLFSDTHDRFLPLRWTDGPHGLGLAGGYLVELVVEGVDGGDLVGLVVEGVEGGEAVGLVT